jgi:hypothetical protein
MLALDQYEAGICACGVHSSQKEPGKHFWDIDTEQCPICAGVDMRMRQYAAIDHEAEAELEHLSISEKAAQPRPDDGRRVFVRQITREQHEQRLKDVRGGD